ncbi:hypothetical protein SAMN05421763_103265 [[Luteovulum] sphaeroides subsp. megalophilum]|uniref:glycine-rich domain-containing protein n=1 Tax=Cereibacter sphaeroides TaxID=1063 RepID=UPI000B648CFF|nr:hypothetical protein [Cereibacter sphaeroides]SNS86509.1 hypothetical protein SAMN05421763_103265 [[Luteovulum] sphaeroides subsp. megalophilum]
MSSRSRYSGSSAGPITGPAFLDQYAGHIDTFYRSITLPLTDATGVNAVTASLDPPLGGAILIDGMRFGITWPAANTAGVTLKINGTAFYPVLDADGGALIPGSVSAGLRSTLEYIGGAFRLQSPLLGTATGGGSRYHWQFTSSGTWSKPAGLDDDAMVTVECWGAGGSGGRASSGEGYGGGGGGYVCGRFRLADLPASVAIVLGAGGAGRSSNGNGSRGGDTTFGTLLAAFGGGGGGYDTTSTQSVGGGGGGELAAGSTAGAAGSIGGGGGSSRASTIWGGGGGGGASLGGGGAVFGGGGGAGDAYNRSGTAGSSVFGGAGGSARSAGAAPGGGGGGAYNATSGAGARGEVRVWI